MSFDHSLEKLKEVSDLKRDQLSFSKPKTTFQLSYCAINVGRHASKRTISETFSTELKYEANCLINWFNKKLKSNTLN